jgi:hypothetical protein
MAAIYMVYGIAGVIGNDSDISDGNLHIIDGFAIVTDDIVILVEGLLSLYLSISDHG